MNMHKTSRKGEGTPTKNNGTMTSHSPRERLSFDTKSTTYEAERGDPGLRCLMR